LRNDVVEAVAKGKFHVYSVETIDQGLALLTGKDAGEPDEDGNYPEGSINYLVDEKLKELALVQKDFTVDGKTCDDGEGGEPAQKD